METLATQATPSLASFVHFFFYFGGEKWRNELIWKRWRYPYFEELDLYNDSKFLIRTSFVPGNFRVRVAFVARLGYQKIDKPGPHLQREHKHKQGNLCAGGDGLKRTVLYVPSKLFKIVIVWFCLTTGEANLRIIIIVLVWLKFYMLCGPYVVGNWTKLLFG